MSVVAESQKIGIPHKGRGEEKKKEKEEDMWVCTILCTKIGVIFHVHLGDKENKRNQVQG